MQVFKMKINKKNCLNFKKNLTTLNKKNHFNFRKLSLKTKNIKKTMNH